MYFELGLFAPTSFATTRQSGSMYDSNKVILIALARTSYTSTSTKKYKGNKGLLI